MIIVHTALAYAARGWPVIPLELGGKAPLAKLVRNGVSHATTDPTVIREWWTRSRAANIGIACSAFLAVDFDPRNGGDEAHADLVAEHGPFAMTPTVRTGSGGLHILFRRPAQSLTGKLCQGVDLVHGARRYIVAAPSIHPSGNKYEWITPPTVPLAEAPAWLIAMAQPVERQATEASRSSSSAESSSQRVARGRTYASRLEAAVSGQGGSASTMSAIAKLVHKVGLTADETFEALSDWNRSCVPPWSDNDLKRKIEHVVNGAGRERRSA